MMTVLEESAKIDTHNYSAAIAQGHAPTAAQAARAPRKTTGKQAGKMTLASRLTCAAAAPGARNPAPVSLALAGLPIVSRTEYTDNAFTRYRADDVVSAITTTGISAQTQFYAQVSLSNRENTDASFFYQPAFFTFEPQVAQDEDGNPKDHALLRDIQEVDATRSIHERVFLNSPADRAHAFDSLADDLLLSLRNNQVQVTRDFMLQLERQLDPLTAILQHFPFLAHHLFMALPDLQVIYAPAWLQYAQNAPTTSAEVIYLRYNSEQVDMPQKRNAWMQPAPIEI